MDACRWLVDLCARRSRRSALGLGGALVVAAGLVGMVGLLAPAGAAAASCPEPSGGIVYFNGTLSEGALKIGPNASAEGISGSVTCGQLNLATGKVIIPAKDITYSPFQLVVAGLLPFEATITLDGPAEGKLEPVNTTNEAGETETIGYTTSFTAPAISTVTTSALGLGLSKCSDGPITPTLTTGRSGSLEGTMLRGSIATSLEGALAANEFAVPAIQESVTCPGAVALLSNTVIGLPRASGESSMTTKVAIKAAG
jgi:hypothetical protein